MDYIEELKAFLESGESLTGVTDFDPEDPNVEIQDLQMWTNFHFRTLFDCLSSEWHETTIDEKLEAIRMLKKDDNMYFIQLLPAYMHQYKDRPDIQEQVAVSLCWILNELVL